VADVTWLWPGWIPSGFVTVLAAAPGDGKSALSLDFAGRILAGTPWPDGQPNTTPATGPVLVLDSEGCQAIWVQRIRDWGLPGARILFPGTGFERVLLDDPNALLAVRNAVTDHEARLLIVDSLRSALPAGVDENSSEVGAILAPWADLARDTGLALLIVHHFGKPNQHDGKSASLDRLRGSTAIGAAARSVLAIDRPQNESRADDPTMRLSCVKSNLAPMPEPIGFAVTASGVTYCEAPAADPDKHAPARAIAAEFLLEVLKDGAKSVGEIVDLAGERSIGKNALYRAKDKLRLVDLTDESDPMRRRKLWGLPAKSTDSSGWR
jgi:hypothetical protein